jgi:predicted transcriptional regulator
MSNARFISIRVEPDSGGEAVIQGMHTGLPTRWTRASDFCNGAALQWRCFVDNEFISLTAQIVSAHIAANRVSADQLPTLIRDVHQALATVGQTPAEPEKREPAVDVKKSVFSDHIICLECGQSLKMLKRHLATDHGMTPDEYRAKWNLPPSYPMVAPEYAATRSKLAKDMGLGRKAEAPPPPPKKAGRPKRG